MGAKRVLISLYFDAFGSGGSFLSSLTGFFSSNASGCLLFSSASCCSGESLPTSPQIFATSAMSSFAFCRSSGNSAIVFPRVAPASGLPPWRKAFARAFLLMASRISCVKFNLWPRAMAPSFYIFLWTIKCAKSASQCLSSPGSL